MELYLIAHFQYVRLDMHIGGGGGNVVWFLVDTEVVTKVLSFSVTNVHCRYLVAFVLGFQ